MITCRIAEGSKEADAVLVTAAKAGKSEAFDELIRRYQHRVLRLANRITKNYEDAEDVVQESFHKAYLHIHDFQEKSRFSTWLMRIAINESFMLLRHRSRGNEMEIGDSSEVPKVAARAFVDRQPDPEMSCWRRERSDALRKAINRLNSSLRAAVVLRTLEERSVEETAQILGTTTGTVKARLFHGRRKLQTIMDPNLFGDSSSFRSAESFT